MGAKPNKPILLAIQKSEEDPLPESLSQVLIVLANGEFCTAYIDTSINGSQLKELIYTKVNPLLAPKEMMIQLNEKRINDEDILEKILTLRDVIIQKKNPLQQVSKVEFLSQIEDEISLEKGVIKMPCGHLIGRQSIMSLLQCVASEKKWQIYCPYEKCNREWDYSLCRKLGTLTNEEDAFFTSQFTNSWLEYFAKNCPGCGLSIMKNEGNNCNKVKCSNKSCKFGYFCFKCLGKWLSNDYEQCGNEECSFQKNYHLLQQMKQISLLDNQKQKAQVTVSIPVMRLCPKCNLQIQHISGCKHMKCYNCKTDFCWICLSTLKREWPCGSYNQYCGTVAPIQKFK